MAPNEVDDHPDIVKVADRVPVRRTLFDLIADTLDKGTDPQKLERLYDLYEREQKRLAEAEYNADMAACQAEMAVVVYDALNKGASDAPYARLEHIMKTCKPTWLARGFALTFSDSEGGPGEGWKRTACEVRHKGGHMTRHFIDLPLDGIGPKGKPIGGMNVVQAAVSTGSYGVRVLTTRIFNITIAGTDVDGQSVADILRVNEKMLAELRDLVEQENVPLPKLLAWIYNVPEAELGEEHTLANLTQKQFKKTIHAYRRKWEERS